MRFARFPNDDIQIEMSKTDLFRNNEIFPLFANDSYGLSFCIYNHTFADGGKLIKYSRILLGSYVCSPFASGVLMNLAEYFVNSVTSCRQKSHKNRLQ